MMRAFTLKGIDEVALCENVSTVIQHGIWVRNYCKRAEHTAKVLVSMNASGRCTETAVHRLSGVCLLHRLKINKDIMESRDLQRTASGLHSIPRGKSCLHRTCMQFDIVIDPQKYTWTSLTTTVLPG